MAETLKPFYAPMNALFRNSSTFMNSDLNYWNIYCLSQLFISLFKQSILNELKERDQFNLTFYFKNGKCYFWRWRSSLLFCFYGR